MIQQRTPVNIALFVVALVAAGCSSGPRTRPDGGVRSTDLKGNSSAVNSDQQYGPSLSEATLPNGVYGPQPTLLKPLTLVFGPGMARGFAHIGVLRALTKHKIPIGAIYGTEMGGLIGAIYANDNNINHFEWNLLRLRNEIFTSKGSLMARFFGSGESPHGDLSKMNGYLRHVFDHRDISRAKIPLRIEVLEKGDRTPVLMQNGSYLAVLRAALGSKAYFGPGTLDGDSAQSATDVESIDYLCSEARAESGGPVVLIDTSVTRNDPSAADLVIRPDLTGISPNDFAKRTDAAYRGKEAVEKNLPELRHWVGLPPENSDTSNPPTL